jgi:hypothetical protein
MRRQEVPKKNGMNLRRTKTNKRYLLVEGRRQIYRVGDTCEKLKAYICRTGGICGRTEAPA